MCSSTRGSFFNYKSFNFLVGGQFSLDIKAKLVISRYYFWNPLVRSSACQLKAGKRGTDFLSKLTTNLSIGRVEGS